MIGGSRRRHACRRAKTLWRLAYSLTLQTRSIQGLYVSDRQVYGQTLSLGLKVDGAKACTCTRTLTAEILDFREERRQRGKFGFTLQI